MCTSLFKCFCIRNCLKNDCTRKKQDRKNLVKQDLRRETYKPYMLKKRVKSFWNWIWNFNCSTWRIDIGAHKFNETNYPGNWCLFKRYLWLTLYAEFFCLTNGPDCWITIFNERFKNDVLVTCPNIIHSNSNYIKSLSSGNIRMYIVWEA